MEGLTTPHTPATVFDVMKAHAKVTIIIDSIAFAMLMVDRHQSHDLLTQVSGCRCRISIGTSSSIRVVTNYKYPGFCDLYTP